MIGPTRRAGERRTGEEIANLADGGCAAAIAAFEEFGRGLGEALSWLINIVDPEVVALGGGIARSFAHFAPAMSETIAANTVVGPQVRVYASRLGDSAAIAGAARLYLDSRAELHGGTG